MSAFKKKPHKKRPSTPVKKTTPALPKAKPQQWVPPFPNVGKRPTNQSNSPISNKEQPKIINAMPTYILPESPKETDPIFTKASTQKPKKETVYLKEQKARKEFLRVFKSLTHRWRSWDIWTDFVTMAACALSNVVDESHFEEREATYMRIINKYNKEEQELFPELFAHLVMALEENPEQDFLGDVYTELGLNSKEHRQIFTPYHVAQLMAEVTVGDIEQQIKEKGFVSIFDCCCGGGVTLIAAVNTIKDKLRDTDLNFQNHVLVVGQDIDPVVTMMCYIQLSLLGVAGYFKVGNSLTEPMSSNDSLDNYWFTPMYYSPIWYYRRVFQALGKFFQTEPEQKELDDSTSRSD